MSIVPTIIYPKAFSHLMSVWILGQGTKCRTNLLLCTALKKESFNHQVLVLDCS